MLGGFLRRRLGQEQHSKQKAMGPHPDGACSLGTHDRRTSGHSLSYLAPNPNLFQAGNPPTCHNQEVFPLRSLR